MFLAGCSTRKGCGSILGSADGERWEVLHKDEGKDRAYTFYAFAQANGVIVAVGGGDSPYKTGPLRVLASKDGKSWEGPCFRFESSGPFLCVAHGKDRFVAQGGSGYIGCFSYSSDGKDWADPDKKRLPGYGGEHSMIKKLAFGNERFIGIGSYRRLMTSADGMTWKDNPDKERPPFISLAFGNGLFVAGGMHGLRMSSKDGLRWENKAEGEIGEHINEIVWTGKEFVGIGVEVTFKSPDGVSWTKHATQVRPARAGYGNGLFLCSNLRGTEAHRSKDAVQWERIAPIQDTLFFGGFTYCPERGALAP